VPVGVAVPDAASAAVKLTVCAVVIGLALALKVREVLTVAADTPAAAKKLVTSSEPRPVARSYPVVSAYPTRPPVSELADGVLLLHIDGIAIEHELTPLLAGVASWNTPFELVAASR